MFREKVPLLFKLAVEFAVRKAHEDSETLKLNGTYQLSSILYADVPYWPKICKILKHTQAVLDLVRIWYVRDYRT